VALAYSSAKDVAAIKAKFAGAAEPPQTGCLKTSVFQVFVSAFLQNVELNSPGRELAPGSQYRQLTDHISDFLLRTKVYR